MVRYIIFLLFYISFAIAGSLSNNTIYDNSWALVVGINDYDTVQDLNYAAEDALAIKNMLINDYGFPRTNVRYLIDKEATQSNIKKELSNLMRLVGENDRVVFYFAGHGETAELGLGEGDIGFLIPSDGSVDDLYFTAIDMGELKRISKFSKAKHMLFFVDACYGGLAAVGTRSLSVNTPNYIDKITKENARQIITAGGKDEKVMEKDEWQHSAFTKNILLGLKEKKADQNQDGYITGSELGLFLQEKVSVDTENYQTPQVRRLTTHEGEIIFHAKIQTEENTTEEIDYQQVLQAMILQMGQQSLNLNNQISTNKDQLVIKPGSIGLYALDPTKEIYIEDLFFRPTGLVYRAKFRLNIDASADKSWGREIFLEIDKVIEIAGETSTGIYNYNTGSVD
jgi:uncharacterized caspase-like protein